MPHWRKATWSLVIWTVIMALWIVAGISGAGDVSAQNCTPGAGSDVCQAAVGLGTGIGATLIFFLWFFGFIIGTIVWFASRPKDNVIVYGPQGQTMTLSEKEAAKRVSQGWTYTPPTAPTA